MIIINPSSPHAPISKTDNPVSGLDICSQLSGRPLLFVHTKLYFYIFRPSINLLNSVTTVDSMRGRWASAALGAGIARYSADQEAQQEIQAVNQANQIEMEKMDVRWADTPTEIKKPASFHDEYHDFAIEIR